jgi:hypothetical protein
LADGRERRTESPPQADNLPHKGAPGLAHNYARIRTVLQANRLGVHFLVDHHADRRAMPLQPGFHLLKPAGQLLCTARPLVSTEGRPIRPGAHANRDLCRMMFGGFGGGDGGNPQGGRGCTYLFDPRPSVVFL